MPTLTVEEAQIHLVELVRGLTPGDEVLLVDDSRPVARIVATSESIKRPIPGRCRGMLTIVRENDDHLEDFKEYME